MKDYTIFCDSSSDIADSLLEYYHIIRIPFYVSFDQEHYEKEIEEISLERFYARLTSEKIFPKTSLPSVADYMKHFSEALAQGKDVLCLCLTSSFSGSFQSARTAAEMLMEENADINIKVVDSMQATGAEGLTVLEAARMKEAGYTLDENFQALEKLKYTSRIMFSVGTLEYLQRGGRIGKAASLAGSLLNLKPLIQLKDGELVPYGTIRGRNRSLAKVVSMGEDFFNENHLNYSDYRFGIIAGETSVKEAENFKVSCEELIGCPIEYPFFQVGVTIGTNTGPDPVGLCFIQKFETL